MLLVSQSRVYLRGYLHTLSCTLRAVYRFEVRLGLSPHGALSAGHDATRVARALLWAMTVDHPAPSSEPVTEESVGQASPVEFAAAVEQAMLLLAASCAPARSEPRAEVETAAAVERTDWHALWAVGRYDLRLSEEEFWSLTPAMLDALMSRLEAERDHAEYCAGLVASQVYNVNLGEGGEPTDATAYMSEKWQKAGAERRARAQAEALRYKLRDAMEMLGASVTRGGGST